MGDITYYDTKPLHVPERCTHNRNSRMWCGADGVANIRWSINGKVRTATLCQAHADLWATKHLIQGKLIANA